MTKEEFTDAFLKIQENIRLKKTLKRCKEEKEMMQRLQGNISFDELLNYME